MTIHIDAPPNDDWIREVSNDADLDWGSSALTAALTAAARWNPNLHPRDRKGRFVSVGDIIQFFLGPDRKSGRVEGIDGANGKVKVRTDRGVVLLRPDQIDESANPLAVLNEVGSKSDIRAWHLTDNPDFTPDPGLVPDDNTIAIVQRDRPGLYLGDPEKWVNGSGYLRPFVAEVDAPDAEPGRWGGESFVPAERFDTTKVLRVIPTDAYVREEYGDYGWIEAELGTTFDTGEPITPFPESGVLYPFKGYRYDGPDVRNMTPEEKQHHLDRWTEAMKTWQEGQYALDEEVGSKSAMVPQVTDLSDLQPEVHTIPSDQPSLTDPEMRLQVQQDIVSQVRRQYESYALPYTGPNPGTPGSKTPEGMPSWEDVKSHIANSLREQATGPVVVRAPRNSAMWIADNGYLTNQFLTGNSMGAYSPVARAQFETRTWGEDARSRIIYGYIDGSGKKNVDYYGDALFVMKPEVGNRSTATFGDSLSHTVAPLPLADLGSASDDEVIGALTDPGSASSGVVASMIEDALLDLAPADTSITGYSREEVLSGDVPLTRSLMPTWVGEFGQRYRDDIDYTEAQIQGLPNADADIGPTGVDMARSVGIAPSSLSPEAGLYADNERILGAVIPVSWVDHIEFDPNQFPKLQSFPTDVGDRMLRDAWESDLNDLREAFPDIPVVWHEDGRVKPYMADPEIEVGSQSAVVLPDVLPGIGSIPVDQPGRGTAQDPAVRQGVLEKDPDHKFTTPEITDLYDQPRSVGHGLLDYTTQTPKAREARLEAMRVGRGEQGIPGFADVQTEEEAIERMIYNMRSVLGRIPEDEHPELWARWYPLAHDHVAERSIDADVDPDIGFAVAARLSPQTDWADNVAMVDFILGLWRDNPQVSQADVDAAHELAKEIVGRGMNAKKATASLHHLDVGDGMSLKEVIDADPEVGAYLIRAYAQVAEIPSVTYDWGTESWVPKRNLDGTPARARWQSFPSITQSLTILAHPNYATVNRELGNDEKIRSFYNDIRDHEYPPLEMFDGKDYRDVTADTHHTGLSLGIPLSASAYEISSSGKTNKNTGMSILNQPKETSTGGRGIYPLIVEATRRLSREPDIQDQFGKPSPAQLQSILWEAWKREWPDGSMTVKVEGTDIIRYPSIRNEWLTDVVRAIRASDLTDAEKDALVEHIRLKAFDLAQGRGTTLSIDAILSGEPAWLSAAWDAQQAHHAGKPTRRSAATPANYERKPRLPK